MPYKAGPREPWGEKIRRRKRRPGEFVNALRLSNSEVPNRGFFYRNPRKFALSIEPYFQCLGDTFRLGGSPLWFVLISECVFYYKSPRLR